MVPLRHPLAAHGRRPAHVAAADHFGRWFAKLANQLLNQCDFVVAGSRYRLAEVEMYYFSAVHPDVFTHRDPLQLESGRWYFHRRGGTYRGGSFKGLDLTLGDGQAHFGILIRTIVAADGRIYDGPCVTVDHLLAKTSTPHVAALDASINRRSVWDTSSPLHIVPAPQPRPMTVYPTARVGLSLKKANRQTDAPWFVGRPYRFLTEPASITQGRPHLILALHEAGYTPEAIHRVTGVAQTTIARYIAAFAAPDPGAGFDPFFGRELNVADFCRLLGVWAHVYGPP